MSRAAVDPREAVISRRLGGVKRILLVTGGKGGVGKSAVASAGGLLLARRGLAVGLLDLDFEGASCHLFLGSRPRLPEEQAGILPLEEAFGLKLMSIAAFTAERPVALRGRALSDAMVELLAITIWGDLDVLLVDMPPGMGDQLLDVLRLMPRSEALLVTTASSVAAAVAARLATLLEASRLPLVGLIRNGLGPPTGRVDEAGFDRITRLGTLPFDPTLEDAVGDPERLVRGSFAAALDEVLRRIFP